MDLTESQSRFGSVSSLTDCAGAGSKFGKVEVFSCPHTARGSRDCAEIAFFNPDMDRNGAEWA